MFWRAILKIYSVINKFIAANVIFCLMAMSRVSCACVADQPPDIGAENGAIVINAETGDVIYEKDADKVAPMASTTKIMSTLIALEQNDLDVPFVVDPDAIKIEGSSMGLREGDRVTIRDLCYGMMLPSGNDAANAIAVKIAGSIGEFAQIMNSKAREIGVKNTNFCTPSGLDISSDDSHHSTARDMAILTKKAMENPLFCEICTKTSKELFFGNPPQKRTIFNHNKLLKTFPGACGVKTGFTKKAGRCLVSAAQRDGIRLIAVVLKDHDDWNDSKALLEYGFSKFSLKELPSDFSEVKLNIAGQNDQEFGVWPEAVLQIAATSEMMERVKVKIKTDPFYFYPVNQGDKVGEAEYFIDEKLIGKVDLCANINIIQ